VSDFFFSSVFDESQNREISLSLALDQTPFFESSRTRSVLFARTLSGELLDSRGQLDLEKVRHWHQKLHEETFPLYPGFENDGVKRAHVLQILALLKDRKELGQALYKISRPHANLPLERMIRQTLLLEEGKEITDCLTRRAVLAALLLPLRQNVGSCFATAPGILVQSQYPLQFLKDMEEVMGTGCLKRIVEGEEYRVPFSYNWGMGEWFAPIPLHLEDQEVWKRLVEHPALLAALKATHTFDEMNLNEEWVSLLRETFKGKGVWGLFSAAEIIEQALLFHYKLTQEEIEAFKHQEDRVVLNDFLPSPSRRELGKFAQTKQYLKGLSRAQETFMGFADLALLKGWEFTLASLSESKANFSKWNLYTALGMPGETEHGVGQIIKGYLQEKIDSINHEIEEYQLKYDHVFAAAKSLEGRVQRAESERQFQWAMADYHMRKQEIHRILVIRDELHEKGRALASLFPFLIKFYTERFQHYFQEVYDARMQEVKGERFDDSPAGFRLLFKHGRANPALWTLIFSSAEYLKALVAFFVSTEVELSQQPECEVLKKEVSSLVTQIIQGIRRPEFLEYSLARLRKAYAGAQRERTPWAYTSGGAMSTLISCYFQTKGKLEEVSRWVESPKELLAFWLDSLRDLPLHVQKIYRDQPEAGMLAFSPTHAFLLKPGWKRFKEGWDNDLYAYTWIRDRYIHPQMFFVEKQLLGKVEMNFFIQELLQKIPVGYRSIILKAAKNLPREVTPKEFHDTIRQLLEYEKWIKNSVGVGSLLDELDALLFEHLPLVSHSRFIALLQEGIDQLRLRPQEALYQKVLSEITDTSLLSSSYLRNALKAFRNATRNSSCESENFDLVCTDWLLEKGLCFPQPVLVADTNWEGRYFGFTVNPGTEEFEFWVFNRSGTKGRPISAWKQYLNGASKKEWGLYINPLQYTI
jgi:phage-related protein